MRRLFTGGNYGGEYKYRSAKEGQPDRQELHELETKEKTGKERLIEKLILVLPGNLRSDSNFGVYADTGQ